MNEFYIYTLLFLETKHSGHLDNLLQDSRLGKLS